MGLVKLVAAAIPVIGAIVIALLVRAGPHQTASCALLHDCVPHRVEGFTSPGYEEVKQILSKSIGSGSELGARATLYSKGKKLFDIWGGFQNPSRTQPWTDRTVGVVFSSTKVVTALAIGLLVDRGLLEYHQPIAKYWPEFAKNGKAHITVSDALRHDTNLFRFPSPLTHEIIADPAKIANFYENLSPDYEFGKGARVYHGLTYGFIPAVLVWKVDPAHRTLGKFIDEEFAKPLSIDFQLGLPRDFDLSRLAYVNSGRILHAIVTLIAPYYIHKYTGVELSSGGDNSPLGCFLERVSNASCVLYGAPITDPEDGSNYGTPADPHLWNKPLRLREENGAAGGVTNAAALAKLGALVANGGELDGVRIFSSKFASSLLSNLSRKHDFYMCSNTTMTQGGVAIIGVPESFPWPMKAYGWAGWGGSVFFFDQEAQWSFSYTMAGMSNDNFHPAAVEIMEYSSKLLKKN